MSSERSSQGSSEPESGGQPRPDEMFCSSCGEIIKDEAEVCPECGVRQKNEPTVEQKSPGIAAVLTFLFGCGGQIYNGQIGKGVAIMAIQVVNVFLAFFVIGFFTGFIVHVWAMYDAYSTAEKLNQRGH